MSKPCSVILMILTNRTRVSRRWRLLLTHDDMGLTFRCPDQALHLVLY